MARTCIANREILLSHKLCSLASSLCTCPATSASRLDSVYYCFRFVSLKNCTVNCTSVLLILFFCFIVHISKEKWGVRFLVGFIVCLFCCFFCFFLFVCCFFYCFFYCLFFKRDFLKKTRGLFWLGPITSTLKNVIELLSQI